MKGRVRLSAAEARRVALAAQGLHRERPGCAPDARHFRRAMQALRLLQLDFVNVLVPAHYLVLWSRLGAYDRERFDRFLYRSGCFTEQWAHEASVVPGNAWPLLAHRRAAYEPSKYNPIRKLRNRRRYLEGVLEQVRADGALTSADLPPLPGPKRKPGDWHRSLPRWALEFHFARGDLAVSHRLPNFQRVYDLPERIIPGEHLNASIDRDAAEREMLRRAAGALGVATLQDLADYFRMSPRLAAPRVAELVEEGALTTVEVENWAQPAYLSAAARLPRAIEGASLHSPFDPMVWYRPRAERLFDFHYRIEIYVPAAKRKWGYYVLPFRLGDRIVARVDLKADRQRGCLLVLAAHEEPGVSIAECADALADELRALSKWLSLETIQVCCRGEFARALAVALRTRTGT
jgi:uncharacterized protein YcaQ